MATAMGSAAQKDRPPLSVSIPVLYAPMPQNAAMDMFSSPARNSRMKVMASTEFITMRISRWT